MKSPASKPQSSSSTATKGQEGANRMPSLKLVAACFLMVALVLALGMTGGQVRQLAGRVTLLEDERTVFQNRVLSLREDNKQLLDRLRDYQEVLEVAQNSNISLSKRLQNRDRAVNDLQGSISSLVEEKYLTEERLGKEIAALENQKRDLSAQVAALGDAVSAQGREITQLETSYRESQRQLTDAGRDNSRLLAENNRYLGMMTDLQDKLEAMQAESGRLAASLDELGAQRDLIAAEKLALQVELEAMREITSLPVEPVATPPDPFTSAATSDDTESVDPFAETGVDPFAVGAEEPEVVAGLPSEFE